MKRGALVPDSLIIRLVEARLDAGRADDAYLFDGFPRTIPQAELLEKSLSRRGGAITHVFFLDAPRKVLVERLTGRRTCRKCSANYHVKNIPPKKEGICDVCGGELYQRADDREETIVNRLEVYNRETESLISHYEKQRLLVRVDSAQGAGELAAEILGVLRKATRAGKR
jgi:adenylate kinase